MKGTWYEKHLTWLIKGRNLTDMDVDEIVLILEVSRLEIKMTRAAVIIQVWFRRCLMRRLFRLKHVKAQKI